MFKIITNAYSQNINFSRFHRNYLLVGVLDDLFYQQVMYLAEEGEIKFENAFIDGTKIDAYANKYTFVGKKVFHKYEEKIFPRLKLSSQI